MNPAHTVEVLHQSGTHMRREALEAPQIIAMQFARNAGVMQALGALLREAPPASLLTIARGSSDFAAQYTAYLIAARLGRLVTSLPMSLVTLYGAPIVCDGLTAMAFSQSGQSPDLVEPIRTFRAQQANTIAFVNDEQSPLAQAAQWLVPLCAGTERSVAATKSFIAQLGAGAQLVAAWQRDTRFADALNNLPQSLVQAAQADWSAACAPLVDAQQLLVIGRGTGLPIAQEAALKFKETCGIQAEAFSGAELKHGPLALIGPDYPVLVFAPRGPAQAGLLALADELRQRGAHVLLAAPAGTAHDVLPIVSTAHEDLDPISAILSFYVWIENLARLRGLNPDAPRHLSKITRTL
jgi:glutamine---fructose-6-phosphate transaminase (isomerizing)